MHRDCHQRCNLSGRGQHEHHEDLDEIQITSKQKYCTAHSSTPHTSESIARPTSSITQIRNSE
eukprot:5258981-Pyramimonas_sp.AAC.1